MDGVSRLSVSTTTAFLIAGVVVLFLVFLFLLLCYLRANRYWGAIPVSSAAHARFALAPRLPCGGLGLDAGVALPPPVVVRPGAFKEGLECPVCLSELAVGEAATLLPRCGHAFHLHCIDMWFCSHSTCPLCRTPAAVEESEVAKSGAQLLNSSQSILNMQVPIFVLELGIRTHKKGLLALLQACCRLSRHQMSHCLRVVKQER